MDGPTEKISLGYIIVDAWVHPSHQLISTQDFNFIIVCKNFNL